MTETAGPACEDRSAGSKERVREIRSSREIAERAPEDWVFGRRVHRYMDDMEWILVFVFSCNKFEAKGLSDNVDGEVFRKMRE